MEVVEDTILVVEEETISVEEEEETHLGVVEEEEEVEVIGEIIMDLPKDYHFILALLEVGVVEAAVVVEVAVEAAVVT